jgi:RNA polymerase sigma-70 factor (ECF subfamily)
MPAYDPPVRSEPDEALVRRARRGDDRAFEELVLRHQDRLYTLALRVTGSEADAVDCVQEGLVAAWRAIGRFRGESKVSTWLYRIVLRKAYDAVEARGRRHLHSVDAAELPLAGPSERVDERLDLVAALAALEPPFRTVAVLCDVLGLGAEEAAAVMNVAPGTVKSRLSRARARLAERLQEENA